jgi:hypothetical protein
MRKGLAFLLLFQSLLLNLGKAQELDSLADTVETVSPSYLFLSSGFQNRVSFMARDFGQKIPLYSADLMYWHRSGIYFNVTLAKFFITDLSWQKGIGGGFARQLTTKTDIDLSYNQYFGASNLNQSGQDNIGILHSTLGVDWGLLYSTTQLMYLVNQPGDFFVVSRHSRYFEVDQRIGGNGILSFEPRLSFYLGTSNYYRIGGYELTWRQYQDTQRFSTQGLDLAVPISLSLGKLDLQLEPRWVIPTQVPEYDLSSTNFQLALKATYAFPLKRTK